MKKIALMGAASVLVGVVLGGTTSGKAAVINILENETALLGHSLMNTRPANYLFGNITGLMFAFVGGNFDDAVTNVTIANNLCSGAFVAPGNSCTCKASKSEPHPAFADVNLQPVAVMLQFMRPARASRWTASDGRAAGLNETGRRIDWLPARITRHRADIAA